MTLLGTFVFTEKKLFLVSMTLTLFLCFYPFSQKCLFYQKVLTKDSRTLHATICLPKDMNNLKENMFILFWLKVDCSKAQSTYFNAAAPQATIETGKQMCAHFYKKMRNLVC